MGEEGGGVTPDCYPCQRESPRDTHRPRCRDRSASTSSQSHFKIRRTGTSRPSCEVRVDNHCCPQETDTVARSTEKDCRRAAEALGEAKGCPRGLAKIRVQKDPVCLRDDLLNGASASPSSFC